MRKLLTRDCWYFYPIFTLSITVLACFIRKKKNVGYAPTPSTGHYPGHSGEFQLPPRPPAAILFGFSKNRCAHIFSVLSSGCVYTEWKMILTFPAPCILETLFDFVSSSVNRSCSFSLKPLSMNWRNFDIFIITQRCSLDKLWHNLVQINFIKPNDFSNSAFDGGIKPARVSIFVVSAGRWERGDECQDFSIT